VLLPVQRQRYAGVAFLLYGAEQLAQLALVQQQLAGAGRVGNDVCAGAGQRRDVRTHQPGFAILEQDVAVDQLSLAGAHALHFPAGQDEARLEFLFDEVVV